MTGVGLRTTGEATLERFWRLFEVDDRDLDGLVGDVFTEDAEVESDLHDDVAIGHRPIVEHLRSLRAARVGTAVRHVTEVQWCHRTARWCWRCSAPFETHRGMDVAHLTADGERIVLLSIFTGLLPPPAS